MNLFGASRTATSVSVALVVLVVSAASGQGVLGQGVTGTVRVAGTGAPLAGARVTLLDPTTRDTLHPSVYTDANGRYTVGTATTGAEDEADPLSASAALDVFPNPVSPAQGALTIRYTAPPNSRLPAVEVFDLFGRRVDQTARLAGGVYLLRLRHEDGTTSAARKVILREGGLLDLRLEPVGAAPVARAGTASKHAGAAGGPAAAVLFVVGRDGYATVEDERLVEPAQPSAHDFSLTSYGLSLSRSERVAAVDAVFAHLRAIAGRGVDEQNAALAQFLATQPAFLDAGVSEDRTVWALFSDGLPLVIVNNRPRGGNGPSGLADAGAAKHLAVQGLPDGNRAYVMDVAGTGEGAPARVAAMLRAAGYEIAGGDVLSGTVEDFRSIRAAAAVHLSSHGAVMQTHDGSGTYAIGTSSSVRKLDYDRCTRLSCDDGYWEEYYTGDLALAIYAEDALQSNPRGHWAVTSQFVEKHWSFAPEGLLFLDACTSASDDPQVAAFRAPLYRANMEHFLGWDAPVGAGFAAKAATYFFDRVLGANAHEPESPLQRPFSYRDVWLHMRTTGRARSGQTALLLKQPGHEPGFLLPSIERLAVFEPETEVWISGSFGPNPGGDGKVTLGGQPLHILSWEDDGSEIRAELPSGGGGDLVVSVGTRASNAVPLTTWNPTFRFEGDVSAPYDLPEKTLTVEVTCDVPLRADVHAYRVAPGEDPLLPYQTVYAGYDLSCRWAGSGSGTNAKGYAYALSGSGEVAWGLEMLKTFAFSGVIDLGGVLNGGKRGVQLRYSIPEVNATLRVDPPEGDGGCGEPVDPDPYDTSVTLSIEGGSAFLEMDAAYGIVAGRAPASAGKSARHERAAMQANGATSRCGVAAPPALLQLADPEVEWDAAPAAHAPASTTKA